MQIIKNKYFFAKVYIVFTANDNKGS